MIWCLNYARLQFVTTLLSHKINSSMPRLLRKLDRIVLWR